MQCRFCRHLCFYVQPNTTTINEDTTIFSQLHSETTSSNYSIEDLHVIVIDSVANQANEQFNRIYNRAAEVTDNEQGIWMLWTSHSYPLQDLIIEELTQIRTLFRQQHLQEGFALLIALTMFMYDMDHWYRDTDVPEVVIKIMKALNSCWINALVHTDKELGVKSGHRDKLIRTLALFGNEVRYMDEDEVMYQFKWNFPLT